MPYPYISCLNREARTLGYALITEVWTPQPYPIANPILHIHDFASGLQGIRIF